MDVFLFLGPKSQRIRSVGPDGDRKSSRAYRDRNDGWTPGQVPRPKARCLGKRHSSHWSELASRPRPACSPCPLSFAVFCSYAASIDFEPSLLPSWLHRQATLRTSLPWPRPPASCSTQPFLRRRPLHCPRLSYELDRIIRQCCSASGQTPSWQYCGLRLTSVYRVGMVFRAGDGVRPRSRLLAKPIPSFGYFGLQRAKVVVLHSVPSPCGTLHQWLSEVPTSFRGRSKSGITDITMLRDVYLPHLEHEVYRDDGLRAERSGAQQLDDPTTLIQSVMELWLDGAETHTELRSMLRMGRTPASPLLSNGAPG